MAKDIIIRGQTYLGAEKVDIPLASGNGDATFVDPSVATLSNGNQMLNGLVSFDEDGNQVIGTIVSRTSSDLSASGPTVTVPAGNYASQETKSVASGSVTAPSSISGTGATLATGSGKLTLTKTVSVTPNVTTAGYVSSGTAGNSSVSLEANVTTKGATTITPSGSAQTISANQYLTGAQTIEAVVCKNLSASNIVAGVTVKVGTATDDDSVASVSGTAQVPIISYDTTTHVLSIS